MGLPSARTDRVRLIALLALAVAPLLLSVILYGPRQWTAQWSEVPVALGWSAARYPRYSPAPPPDPDAERRTVEQFLAGLESHPDRFASLHGLSLVVRESLMPFGEGSATLVVGPELSSDAVKLRELLRNSGRYELVLDAVLRDGQRDLFVEADRMTQFRALPDGNGPGQSARTFKSAETEDKSAALVAPSGVPAVRLWQLLVEAGHVLESHAPASSRHYAYLYRVGGGVPLMNASPYPRGAAAFDREDRIAYAAVLERLCQQAPEQYLESALEDRARLGWQAMGLRPRSADYLARSGYSSSAHVAGWHCARHLEAARAMATDAISAQDFDEAAHWLELTERLANVLKNSVRSPGVFNYVERQSANAASDALTVQNSPDCPAAVAERMAALVARSVPLALRTDPAPKSYPLAAVCLENVSRGCLAIAAVTLAAALLGWLHLRARRRQTLSGRGAHE